MAMFDPSLLVLFLFAITCIIYGCVRSLAFHATRSSDKNKESSETVSALKLRTIIIFVIVGCATLLLLFFLFKIMYYLLLILVSVISFISLFFVGAPLVDYVFGKLKWESKKLELPKLPPIHYSMIAIITLSILFIILWISTGYWLVVDCLAWCIGVTQLSVIRLPNLKLSVILLGAFLVYDVFWVFISPFIFGESVMVTVASKMPVSALPLTMSMPHVLEPDAYSLLGLGDIVLPGLFICFAHTFDASINDASFPRTINDEIVALPKLSYFVISLIGYVAGFLATLISFMIMNKGQPALLYLVPFCVIPVSIAAHYQGHLGLMWTGIAPPPSHDIEDQALLTMKGDEKEDGPTAMTSSPTLSASSLSSLPRDASRAVFLPAESSIAPPTLQITVDDVNGTTSASSSSSSSAAVFTINDEE